MPLEDLENGILRNDLKHFGTIDVVVTTACMLGNLFLKSDISKLRGNVAPFLSAVKVRISSWEGGLLPVKGWWWLCHARSYGGNHSFCLK